MVENTPHAPVHAYGAPLRTHTHTTDPPAHACARGSVRVGVPATSTDERVRRRWPERRMTRRSTDTRVAIRSHVDSTARPTAPAGLHSPTHRASERCSDRVVKEGRRLTEVDTYADTNRHTCIEERVASPVVSSDSAQALYGASRNLLECRDTTLLCLT
eukprot:GHVU01208956.1.p1 GENE.GHVU01208956.1~~GHVU01208956.1.p1  ORF type:complete len:159 (+),score=4.63 GHVU01208956.1:648-1124(+)